jgi:large subunit ribosomal protein L1
MRVLVFARGEKVEEAKRAGADFVGNDELLAKVLEGWTDYDAVIATPDMMRDVGRLGKVLGPRGLMPTPKAGTVTTDVTRAISEVRAGKIEFKQDRHGVVNNGVGKVSFAPESIEQNIRAFLQAVLRAKPAASKGQYIRSLTISSTMGPGLKIDLREVEAA